MHVEQLGKLKLGPFANIMFIDLENRKLLRSEVRQFLENRGQYEVRYLEKGLNLLETIAGVALFIGLLGTIFGIIKVFDKIKEVSLNNLAVFSGDILEALITRVFGPVIKITTLITYNFLSKKAENLITEIENIAIHLIQRINQIELESSGKTK